jgi:predicted ArsR family transcriptional regulator
MDLGAGATRIGALADDTRRVLYEYVVGQPDAVGRDAAANALGLARHNVSFHLDRLAKAGLLEVEYRRLSGRSGPGAGRPNKLYRRATHDVAVSLPPRRYDVVGDILATAVAGATVEGEDCTGLERGVAGAARQAGLDLGAAAGDACSAPPLAAVAAVLSGQGYEARVGAGVVELANCPFDALARRHTSLVCGLNVSFVQGVADGLGCRGVTAHLEPAPGACCVKLRAD